MSRLRMGLRTALFACALSLFAVVPAAHAGSAGKLDFAKPAESSFDRYTQSPTSAQQEWMRTHYSRMRTYAPYFDSRLAWFPNAWSYQDAYAIYRGQESGLENYILKDANGNRLYIPYACSNGSCTQYAADIGDPAWRRHFIDIAKARVSKGYKGIFVDDVNMAFKVGDGNGNFVAPMDKRTAQRMTHDNWQRYFAEFMEQLRAELPSNVEIIQNQVYFHVGLSSAYVKRAIEAATGIEFERGVIDTGITGGTGTYGFETVLGWVDYIHSRGKGVVYDAQATWGREYAMAFHLLNANGLDSFSHPLESDPDNWWTGYDTDLGAPTGSRYSWNGVFRRDFERGTVLVNQPGQTTKSLTLGTSMKTLGGSTVSSVSLPAREGLVLRYVDPPAPPPADTTSPETTLTGGPVGEVTSSLASFTFQANETGAAFECRSDGGAWASCSSPKELSGLSTGSHRFEVRAKDAAGNVDATPAVRDWTVAAGPAPDPAPPADTTAPQTTITKGPASNTTSTSANFSFEADESGASFECRRDGSAWGACSSPKSYSALSVSSHRFEVRAKDAAGNVDATPAVHDWTVRKATSAAAARKTASLALTTASAETTATAGSVTVGGRLVRRGRSVQSARSVKGRVRVTLERRVRGRRQVVRRAVVRVGRGGRFKVRFAGVPSGSYRARGRAHGRTRGRVQIRRSTAKVTPA